MNKAEYNYVIYGYKFLILNYMLYLGRIALEAEDENLNAYGCVNSDEGLEQTFQSIKYSFDTVGNVLGYTNDCMNGIRGNYNTSQSYTYDDLHQLTSAEGHTECTRLVYGLTEYRSSFSSDYTQDYAYDIIGK